MLKRVKFVAELIIVVILELYKLWVEYKHDKKSRAGLNGKRF